jgi:SAM-dependent methyltransferase
MNTPIMSTHTPPNFEPSAEGAFLETLYNVGFRLTEIDAIANAFIQFAIAKKGWTLDVGCAFGIATIPTIIGGGYVIANDLDEQYLDSIKWKIPPQYHDHLQLSKAVFPDDIQLEENSLAGVLISRIFRFFTGSKIEQSLALCFKWLKPGGKIFIGCELMNSALTNAGFLIERSDFLGIIAQKPPN